MCVSPKGGQGCQMFLPCLQFQCCHLIPLSYLLSCSSLQKIIFSLRVRLFCMALVEQLGDNSRWYVQLVAIWHQYLPLSIYIVFLNFALFLFVPFSPRYNCKGSLGIKHQVTYSFLLYIFSGISRQNGPRYQHVLALYALLRDRGNMNGLTP